ncbi:MAG: alpha/beta hydrolase family protein [Candidatus Dormibacteria bacterium]
MPKDIERLLSAPVWRAFDVDDQGRILAGTDESGSIQLVEIEPGGGRTPLTALPGACSGRYLPGRRMVVVEHDQGGDEMHQLSMMALDPIPDAPLLLEGLTPLAHDPQFFHNLLTVGPDWVAYSCNRRNSVDFDLLVADPATGLERVLYDQGGALEEAAVDAGAQSAILARSGPRAMSQQLLLVGPDRAEALALTDVSEPAQHSRATFYPDGKALMVTTDRERDNTVVARLDLPSQRWTELVADPDWDVTGWLSPDGRSVLVMTNRNGSAQLAVHDAVSGARVREIPLPDEGWVGAPSTSDPVWSPNSRFVAVSFTSPRVPGDILLIRVDSGQVTGVTDSSAALAGMALVKPTVHRVSGDDGEEIPCFLYRPHQKGTGSAVVHIHGGPESQAVMGFNPIVQGLAAAGHTVLVPNVRGSTGYGKRWYSADDVRLRLNSIHDLAALHRWLPELGLDPARAALWGGSYGGYMVLAGLAFQPELWAAGVDVVGISSLVTFLENTSPYRRAPREREYGSLEEDREFLESISPLSRVGEIRAPLFVIHGANDPRVPLTEAEQLVAALRSNGVACELLVFQDEGHGLAKRANRLRAYPAALDFLATHLL